MNIIIAMNKKLLVILLWLNLGLFAQVPTNSLSAYYPFNNNTLDYIGTRHGIVPVGAEQYGTDRWGHLNACYDVVGNSNHIMLPNDYWIYGDYSISAWVKVKQTESYPRLYDFGNGYGVNNAIGKLSHGGNGSPTLEYYASSTVDGSNYLTNSFLNIGTWYHLVFISSGTSMKIYKNNVLIGTSNGSHIPENVYRTSNKIGGSNAPLQDDTQAFIDDFRLYDRAITPEEVTQLYNEPDDFVGINEAVMTLNDVVISPNPVSDQVSIRFSSNSLQQVNVKVFDNLGKLVINQNQQSTIGQNLIELNSQKLADGLYFISISNGINSKNMKFVKK
jgi:hypothetical protein